MSNLSHSQGAELPKLNKYLMLETMQHNINSTLVTLRQRKMKENEQNRYYTMVHYSVILLNKNKSSYFFPTKFSVENCIDKESSMKYPKSFGPIVISSTLSLSGDDTFLNKLYVEWVMGGF